LGSSGRRHVSEFGFKNLSVAVVGYGSIGRRHCANLAQLGVERTVIVRRGEGWNPAFVPPDDAIVFHSVPESIETGIDLAIVCNPTAFHVSVAREYFAADISVLIEKPLSADAAQARRLVADAEASGVPAGMAYCLRYHPAYALAREQVRQGALGDLRTARAWFESYLPDWHPWEDYRQSYAARRELGGGVLPTLDHEIDFICWCLGPPRRSTGVVSRSGALDAEIDDTAKLALDYGDHSAEIELSIGQRQRRRGFEFVGSKRSLFFSFEEQHLRLFDHANRIEKTLWHLPDYEINQMYLALLNDALNSLAAGRPLPIPLRAGLDALYVAATAQTEPGASGTTNH
jgi:predicted dehydrogenase